MKLTRTTADSGTGHVYWTTPAGACAYWFGGGMLGPESVIQFYTGQVDHVGTAFVAQTRKKYASMRQAEMALHGELSKFTAALDQYTMRLDELKAEGK